MSGGGGGRCGAGLTFVPVKADALSLQWVSNMMRDTSHTAGIYLRAALPNLNPPLHATVFPVKRRVRVLLRAGQMRSSGCSPSPSRRLLLP